ncbi:MAG: DUF4058 family protein [Planctomycetia bacterium]|nr:DUF4058 family protein [Planctomycetia bacterium]
MRCPFPGMDPYVERSAIWPDFHDAFISYLREAIQPSLRPKYAALGQDRLYVVDSGRPIRPDVSIVRMPVERASAAAVALAEPDAPVIVELSREEIREPLLYIIEPAAGNRIVTAIEVLSPDNKRSGPGRDSYLNKQEELWAAGAHLVEIDLLRAGCSTVRVPQEELDRLKPHHYLVSVTRCVPTQCELYGFALQQRLPRIQVPLANGDPDIPLDLQAVFQRCWESGPYPELLQYDAPPPGELDADDLTWCRQQLVAAGIDNG